MTSALLNEDKNQMWQFVGNNQLPWVMSSHLLSYDCHMIIMQLYGPIRAWLAFCGYLHVNVKLIQVDHCDRKMLMPVDLNNGVCDTKTEPTAAQLAILPSPYLCM